MTTAPPVLCFFPGSGGFGPVAPSWWPKFCTEFDATAMLAKVQALGQVNAKLIDSAGPGGSLASFGAYFQYLDTTTRMWEIQGTLTVGENEYVIGEMAGELIGGETKPRPFIDKYNTGQTAKLMYNAIDPTTVELYWGS